MTMKTLLDDAAAHATADRQIDLTLVLERAETERVHGARIVRLRGGVAFLAVAAVIALIAVLLPVGSLVRGEGIPASEPSPVPAVTGVPATWYYAPVWTPPVTRHPMTAAVMVLSADLQHGSVFHRSGGPGPVLVSADAKTYAALPDWGPDDGGVTLSADGRQVAWWTAPPISPGGSAYVHRLILATGEQTDYRLDPVVPQSMVWSGDDIYLSSPSWGGNASGTGARKAVVRLDPDGTDETVCECAPVSLAIGPDGRVLPDLSAAILEQQKSRVTRDPDIAAPARILSPDGQDWAIALRFQNHWAVSKTVPGFSVVNGVAISRNGPVVVDHQATQHVVGDLFISDRPIVSDEPVESAKVLAWTGAGIFLQVTTREGPGEPIHRSIRLMDSATGKSTIVSRPHGFGTTPVAVASDLLTTGTSIAAPPPAFDTHDRAHLAFLVGLAWNRDSFWTVLAGGLLVAGIAGVLVAWRMRRRHRVAATALAGESG